ncbi:MAG: hypothetical protein WC683_02300 [bacterium]
MADKPKLDTREARQLTSRECCKILGGTIGVLAQMASLEDVRTAVRWWAETEEVWTAYALGAPAVDAATQDAIAKVRGSGDS